MASRLAFAAIVAAALVATAAGQAPAAAPTPKLPAQGLFVLHAPLADFSTEGGVSTVTLEEPSPTVLTLQDDENQNPGKTAAVLSTSTFFGGNYMYPDGTFLGKPDAVIFGTYEGNTSVVVAVNIANATVQPNGNAVMMVTVLPTNATAPKLVNGTVNNVIATHSGLSNSPPVTKLVTKIDPAELTDVSMLIDVTTVQPPSGGTKSAFGYYGGGGGGFWGGYASCFSCGVLVGAHALSEGI